SEVHAAISILIERSPCRHRTKTTIGRRPPSDEGRHRYTRRLLGSTDKTRGPYSAGMTAPAELAHLRVERGVATITLDSPHNRNALSAQLRRELRDHLASTAADEAARVVVLTHTGSVFCSGMDLKESRGAGASEQGVNEFPRILETIWTHPKPVV